MVKTLEMEVLVADGTDDDNGIEAQQQSNNIDAVNTEMTPRARLILAAFGFFLLCALMYFWNAELAQDGAISELYTKAPEAISNSTTNNKYDVVENVYPEDDNVTLETGFHEGILNASSVIDIHTEEPPSLPAVVEGENIATDTGECPALCDSRDEARKKKFGGDLLDLSNVLDMAKKARDKLIAKLKVDYGDKDFDGIFVKEPGPNATKDTPPSYQGMQPLTEDGGSRERMKRKLQLKVLKMMESLKISDENVHGCNCLSKTGSTTANETSFMADVPDYYQKYVWVNGGHSASAGHGNTFDETYTAYVGDDLRPLWEAIAVEMIDRNMGMGGMRASPDISACSKEIFGKDVDFLVWNYAMTDGSPESWVFYTYRAAISESRPAMVNIDFGKWKLYGPTLEQNGLSLFEIFVRALPTMKTFPDSSPDGIPLSTSKMNQLAPFVQHLKCNGRMEGDGVCKDDKWSCSPNKMPCDCPNVAKRSGWHPGYRVNALIAHFLSLPIVEMLLEGISDLIAMDKDLETLLQELQKEEDEDFEKFLSLPLNNITDDNGAKARMIEHYANLLGDEYENWFKGPSICRTSLMPAMTRYLGISTNSNKVGGSARCGEETYETGIPFDRNDGVYTYTSNRTPPLGEFSLMAANDMRLCKPDCSKIVMPDYKDWYMGNWTLGSATLTFPNEKEKEYYGYDPKKFKGILAIIPTIYTESNKAKTIFDIPPDKYEEHITMTVNGEEVKKIRFVDSMAILEGPNGIYWKPSRNNDYVMEFKPKGKLNDGLEAREKHLRFAGFVLY